MAKASSWSCRIPALIIVALSLIVSPFASYAQNDACKTIGSGRTAKCQHPGAGCAPETGRAAGSVFSSQETCAATALRNHS